MSGRTLTLRPRWQRILRFPMTFAKIVLITPRHPLLCWRLAMLTLTTPPIERQAAEGREG